MPMIVNGFPFRYVRRPSVCGSALKRDRHSRSLMTTTGCAFGVRSSSGVITRPCAARTPSMSK